MKNVSEPWAYNHIPTEKRIKVGKINLKAELTIEQLEKQYNELNKMKTIKDLSEIEILVKIVNIPDKTTEENERFNVVQRIYDWLRESEVSLETYIMNTTTYCVGLNYYPIKDNYFKLIDKLKKQNA